MAQVFTDNGATEVFSTSDPEEGEAFVAARRYAIPAVEAKGSLLLEDVGVPLPALADLVSGIAKIAAQREVLISVIAHAGDGNTHPLIVFDPADTDMAQRAELAFGEIMDLAVALGGTITGEHGVGRLKRPGWRGRSGRRQWNSIGGSRMPWTPPASSTRERGGSNHVLRGNRRHRCPGLHPRIGRPIAGRSSRGGAPNVLYLLWDDTGIATWDCYGGLVDMPNLRRIADRGVRLTQFHTTALCSPTRAALLTGRNPTSVGGVASVLNLADGFPRTPWPHPPRSRRCCPRCSPSAAGRPTPSGNGIWRPSRTARPRLPTVLATAPRIRPVLRISRRDDRPVVPPTLVRDNDPIDPPASPEQGYHLSKDLADNAIGFLRDHRAAAPDKPWFMYLCRAPATPPHQVAPPSGPTGTPATSIWATSATARSPWPTRRPSACSRRTPSCPR